MEGSGGNPILHERQKLQLCLKHALNNLLQGEHTFAQDELNNLADSLDEPLHGHSDLKQLKWWPFRSHHNSITGNFDVNVLMAALASLGKEVTWLDKRKGLESLNLETGEVETSPQEVASGTSRKELFGLILNLRRKWAGIIPSGHWIALRKLEGDWYNLDSDLRKPLKFDGGPDYLRTFLDESLSRTGSELLVITREGGPRRHDS